MFHLARRENGFAIGHVCSLIYDEDDGALLGLGNAASADQGQVSNGVVINAVEMGEGEVVMHLPHVGSNDAAVGTTVNQSAVPGLGVTIVVANPVRWLAMQSQGVHEAWFAA